MVLTLPLAVAKRTGGCHGRPPCMAHMCPVHAGSMGGELHNVFERIALEQRRQYAIGYRPPNFAADGKWHRIKVKIDPPRGQPRLSIRHRNVYHAVANPS
jgi:hypothetical protein